MAEEQREGRKQVKGKTENREATSEDEKLYEKLNKKVMGAKSFQELMPILQGTPLKEIHDPEFDNVKIETSKLTTALGWMQDELDDKEKTPLKKIDKMLWYMRGRFPVGWYDKISELCKAEVRKIEAQEGNKTVEDAKDFDDFYRILESMDEKDVLEFREHQTDCDKEELIRLIKSDLSIIKSDVERAKKKGVDRKEILEHIREELKQYSFIHRYLREAVYKLYEKSV